MSNDNSNDVFYGKQVRDYDASAELDTSGDVAYRLRVDYDDEDGDMSALIEEFLNRMQPENVHALIIGAWGEPYDSSAADILATLIKHAPNLPNLRALYVGDMSSEECEISWIVQSDYTELLNAFPALELLRVRGGQDLSLSPITHQKLRFLAVETGGLSREFAQALAESKLPALEYLELWLGSEEYGFNGDAALYQQLLTALHTPALRYLGLCNAPIADEMAVWLAQQSWLSDLAILDFSMGTLGDVGAEALFNSPYIKQLESLVINYHYISEEWQDKLRSLPFEVEIDDEQDEFEYDEDEAQRYVAVGE